MKSVILQRRARRVVVGVGVASVILGFVACSGSSERRSARSDGNGGDGGAEAGQHSGGSSSQAGDKSAGGESAAGAAGRAGSGGDTGGPGAGGEGGTAGESNVGGQSLGGEGGTAGEPNVGGQSLGGEGGTAGGEGGASGEAGAAGSGGEGGSGGVVDPVCGLNMVQVGAYSLWCGKVNMHETAEGTWTHDADCTSGCNINGVAYCQKYYPAATAVVTVPQLETKDWKNAGCNDSTPDGPGIDGEAACCAPLVE